MRARRADPLLGALPGVALLLMLVVAPLLIFVVYSLLTSRLYEVSRPFTSANYHDAISSNLNRALARNSVVIGVLTAAFTTLLAVPVAYWLRHGKPRLRSIALALIVTSFITSYLVRIYSWRTVLGTQGVLNSFLAWTGITDQPVQALLFSRVSVTLALVHIFLPYSTLTMYAALGPLSNGYLEAAQDLGANSRQRWSRLIVPVVFAPALSSFVLVFVLSASDYVTPQFLGGTSGATVGTQVQVAFTGEGNYGGGAALSMLMLVAFLGCYAIGALIPRWLRLDRLRFMS